jgi:hypothetical protein
MYIHGVGYVTQPEIYTAELLVPEPSSFVVKMTIAKLNRYKSSGSNQIPAEVIQAGGRTICSEIHKVINSIWNKEELPQQWKESMTVPIYTKGDKTDCSDYQGISLLSTIDNILSVFLSRLT